MSSVKRIQMQDLAPAAQRDRPKDETAAIDAVREDGRSRLKRDKSKSFLCRMSAERHRTIAATKYGGQPVTRTEVLDRAIDALAKQNNVKVSS